MQCIVLVRFPVPERSVYLHVVASQNAGYSS